MRAGLYLYTILFIIALSLGVTAQQNASAVSAKSDSAIIAAQHSPQQKQTLNKQNGVYRPVKNTNWSKIKALFE
jgi:hypothetical protein